MDMTIGKVGIVGAGLMGSGIAQVCAQSGYDTIVAEVNQQALDKGLKRIDDAWTMLTNKGRLPNSQAAEARRRLHGTIDLQDFADCDLVIEAIIENMDEKKKLFPTLDGILKPGAIICSNTSSLTIIEMAATTKRPDKVAGLHFFNPAPVMKLVEVVRTIATSDGTLQTVRSFAESLGKTPIIAKDTAGFVVNALLIPYLCAAIRMYEAGVASKEDIDTGMKLGCGYPMGPFTLLDYVGLDTAYYAAQALYEEFKDPFFAPPPLLRRMVLAGYYGKKNGKGFYDYPERG
jgi:3-hydroxybutyryl-CoA dehydrogenase